MVIIKIFQGDEALVQNIKISHEKHFKKQPTWYNSAPKYESAAPFAFTELWTRVQLWSWYLSINVIAHHLNVWLFVLWTLSKQTHALHFQSPAEAEHRSTHSLCHVMVHTPGMSPEVCAPCWGPTLWQSGSLWWAGSDRYGWTWRPTLKIWSQRRRSERWGPQAPQILEGREREKVRVSYAKGFIYCFRLKNAPLKNDPWPFA